MSESEGTNSAWQATNDEAGPAKPESPNNDDVDEAPASKRRRCHVNLSREQENALVIWLKQHPELYDRGDESYRDWDKKDDLWNTKAKELRIESAEMLITWYKSMRTRFGKLVNGPQKPGWRPTYRDKWIMDSFPFLKPFLGPKRLRSHKSYNAAASDSDGEYENGYIVDDSFNPPAISEVLGTASKSRRSTRNRHKAQSGLNGNVSDPTLLENADTVLNNIDQYERMQAPVSELIPAPPATLSEVDSIVAKSFGSFLASIPASLHPSLINNFMQESMDMVMRYKTESDRLKAASCITQRASSSSQRASSSGQRPSSAAGVFVPDSNGLDHHQLPGSAWGQRFWLDMPDAVTLKEEVHNDSNH